MPTGGRVSPDARERNLGDGARSSRRLAWTLPDKGNAGGAAGSLTLDPEAPPASTSGSSSPGQEALSLVASALGAHSPPPPDLLTPAQGASPTLSTEKNPAASSWDAVRRNRQKILSLSKGANGGATAVWAIAAMSAPLRRQHGRHAGMGSSAAGGAANSDMRRGIRARQKEPTMRPQERLWRALRDARETPGVRGWAIRRGIPLIGAALFCIDVVSDAVLAKNLFGNGYPRLGILTVAFMFSHYIPTYIMLLRAANQAFFAQHTLLINSIASVSADVAAAGAAGAVSSNQSSSIVNGMARVLESMHLFYYALLVIFGLPLLPILDAYMVLTAVILTTDRGNAGYTMRVAEDFCRQYERVRLPLECFLESLPQTALQVYLYIQTRSGTAVEAVKVSQSVLSISLLGSVLNLINVSWEMYNAWRASGDTLLEYLDALIRLQGSTKVPIEAQNAMLQRISDHLNRLSEHDEAAQKALGPAHAVSVRRGDGGRDEDADMKGAVLAQFAGLPPTMVYTLGGPGDTGYQALSAFQRRSLMDVLATPAKVRFANLRAVQLLHVDASVAARLLRRLVSLPPYLRLTGTWQGRRASGGGGAGDEQGQTHQSYFNVITKYLPDATMETDLAAPLLDLHLSRLPLAGYYSGTAAVAAPVGGVGGSGAAISSSTAVGRALGNILASQPALCRLVVDQCDVYARAMLEAIHEGMIEALGKDGDIVEMAVEAEAVAAAEEQRRDQVLAARAAGAVANGATVYGDIHAREEAWARRAALLRVREASGPRLVAIVHADGGTDLEYWLEERARNASLVVVGSSGTQGAGVLQSTVSVSQSAPSMSAAALGMAGNNNGQSGNVGNAGMGELRELHFVPNYRARMITAESKVLLVPCPRSPGLMDLLSLALSTVLHPPRLTLSNTDLRPEDTAAIGATLVFNRSIEGLEMRSCSLGSESLLQMLPGLACHTTLISLDLSSNPAIGDVGLEGLAGVLPHLPGLSTLILAKCGMGARGADAVAGQLLASASYVRLSDLDLQDNKEECGTPALEWLCFTYQRRTNKQAKAPTTRRLEVDEGGPIVPSFGLTGEFVTACLQALTTSTDTAPPDTTQQKDTSKAVTNGSTPDTESSSATKDTLTELVVPSDAAGDVAQLVLLCITAESAANPLALRLGNWVEKSSRSASAAQGVLPPAPAALPGFTHARGSVSLLAAVTGSLMSLNPQHLRTLDLSSVPLASPLPSAVAGPFAASGLNMAAGGSLYLTPLEHLCLGLSSNANLRCLRLVGCGLDDDAVVALCTAASRCPLLGRLELHGNPRLLDKGLLNGVMPLLQAAATGEDTFGTDADEAKGVSGAVVAAARTAGSAKAAHRSIGAARQGGSGLVVTADATLGDEGLQESTVTQLLAAARSGWVRGAVEGGTHVHSSAAATRTVSRAVLQLLCHDNTTDSIAAELLALPRAAPADAVVAPEAPAKALATSDDGVQGGRKVVARLPNDAHAVALALALCQVQVISSTTATRQKQQQQEGAKPTTSNGVKQQQSTPSTLATAAAAASNVASSAGDTAEQEALCGIIVRVLDLEGSRMSSLALAALGAVLQHVPVCANLRCLRLVGCGLDDDAVVALCASISIGCVSLEELDLQCNPRLRDRGFLEGIVPLLQAAATVKTNDQVVKKVDQDNVSSESAAAAEVSSRTRPSDRQLRVTASANGDPPMSAATMTALLSAVMQIYGLGGDSSLQDGWGQMKMAHREFAPASESNAATGGPTSRPVASASAHNRRSHKNNCVMPRIQLILLGNSAGLNDTLAALCRPPPAATITSAKRPSAVQGKTAGTAPEDHAADDSEATVEPTSTDALPEPRVLAPTQPQPPPSKAIVTLATDGDALAVALALCQQHPRCAAALRVIDLSGSKQMSRVGLEVLLTALRSAPCGPYLQELLLSGVVDGVGDDLVQLLVAAVPALQALRRLDVTGAMHVLSVEAAETLVRALKEAADHHAGSENADDADRRVCPLEEDSVEVLRLSDDERVRAANSFNGSTGDKAEAGTMSEDNEDEDQGADQDERSVWMPRGAVQDADRGAEQGSCNGAPQRLLLLGPLPASVKVLHSLAALTAGMSASDGRPAKACVSVNGLPPWTCMVWTGSCFVDSLCTAITTSPRLPASCSTATDATCSPEALTASLAVLPGIHPSTMTAPQIMAIAWAICQAAQAARGLPPVEPDLRLLRRPMVAVLRPAGGAADAGQGSEVAKALQQAQSDEISADGPVAVLIVACNIYRAALLDAEASPAAGAHDRKGVVEDLERPTSSIIGAGTGNAGQGKVLVRQASSQEHLMTTGVDVVGGTEAWRSMPRSPAELPRTIADSTLPVLPEVEVAVGALTDSDAAALTVALLAGWMGRDHRLDLAGCNLSEEGLRVVLHLLPLHSGSLAQLSLAGLVPLCTSPTLQQSLLSACLPTLASLTSLDLRGLLLPPGPLAEALAGLNRLKRVVVASREEVIALRSTGRLSRGVKISNRLTDTQHIAPVKELMISVDLTGLNITPDGSTLLTADSKNNIHIFDIATGTCTTTFDGVKQDGYNMLALHPSPDGRQMVCGSKDGAAWVFDLATGKRVAVLPGHGRLVNCAVFSADGSKVVTCSYDKFVKVHDIATSTCIATLDGHSDEINYIAISPDGTRVASCADDGFVVVHDITDSTRAPIKLRPQRIRGNRVAWHPTLPHIAVTSNNKTVQVIHAETGAVQVTFKGHTGDVTRVGWHPSGRLLATGCVEGQVRLWSPAAKACVAVLPNTPGVSTGSAGIRGTVFTPDGLTLVTACGRVILKWSTEPFMSAVELLEAAAARRAAATADVPAAASADGDKEAEAGGPASGAVVGWLSAQYDGSNAVCDELWPAQTQGLYGVSVSPSGLMVAAASKDCTARLFDVSQPGSPCITLSGDSIVVTCVALAPDASFAVTGGEKGALLVHSLPAGTCTGRLLGHESQTITCVAISPDGLLVASGSRAKGLLFLHERNATETKRFTGKRLEGHKDTIWAVAFAPDASRRLASCGQDGTIQFWSLDSFQAVATIRQEKPFNTIAYSPDASRLFAADDKNTITAYDTANQQRLLEFQNPSSFVTYVQTLAVSRDGRLLASFTTGAVPGSTDTVKEQLARIWDVRTGAPVGMLPHPQQVTGVAFGTESLVTACWDGRVRMFNLHALTNWEDWEGNEESPVDTGAVMPFGNGRSAGQLGDTSSTGGKAGGGSFWPMRLSLQLRCNTPVAVLSELHKGCVWSVAFSPDSKLLLTSSHDGTVQLTHAGTKWTAAATLEYDMPDAAISTGGGNGSADVSSPSNDPFSITTAFSPDGRMVAAGGGVVPVVRLWLLPDSLTTASQAQFLALSGHKGQVLAVAFSPDGHTLASAGADTQVLLHDLSALQLRGAASYTSTAASVVSSVALTGHTSAVLSVAFHPDGNLLAASGEDGSILYFSVRTRGVLQKVQVPGYAQVAACLRFSPSGGVLAACTVYGTVFLYDAQDGSHVAVLPCNATSTAPEHQPVQTPPDKLDSDRVGAAAILRDDFTVHYRADHTAVGTALANFPAPTNTLLYYYEVKILSGGARGTIGVGFADKSYSLEAQPGWRSTSCGYHGDDGKYFYNTKSDTYGPPFTTGDVIGAGLLIQSEQVFYTKNGVQLNLVNAPGINGMYPAIGLHSEGEQVYVNFGQEPFMFNVEAFKADLKTSGRTSVPVTEKNARPGLVVVRGADWKWGDQDGGAGKTGKLTEPSSTGWYSVKWDNGGSYSYRIGGEGKYDLQTRGNELVGDLIKDSFGQTEEVVTRSNAAEGMKVVRGPNWKWSDQDGGAGNMGKIILVKTDGWARVEWEHNKSTNAYRIGAEDSYDLKVVLPVISGSKLPDGSRLICKMGRLVFAPSGEFLIASAPDNLLRVWQLDGFGRDMRTYCVAQLEGVKSTVLSLDITRDSTHLAVSSQDKAITLYDVAALLNG